MLFKGKIYLGSGRCKRCKKEYYKLVREIIDYLYNHPSIIVWVPFNEGWGQFDTYKVTEMIKSIDKTRLVDSASGWIDVGAGDMKDVHSYPKPKLPEQDGKRAMVCGEYGGLGLICKEHVWKCRFKWAYRKYRNSEELKRAYENVVNELKELIKNGLSASVYTQIVDVEGEVNGLLTYDREVMKISPEEIKRINRSITLV